VNRKLKILIIAIILSLGLYGQPPGNPPVPPIPDHVCNKPHPPPNCPQVPLSDWFAGSLLVLMTFYSYKKLKNIKNERRKI